MPGEVASQHEAVADGEAGRVSIGELYIADGERV